MSTGEHASQEELGPDAGMARLPVVVIVSLINMFSAAILEYSLPLYFNVLEGFPKSMWADLAAWQVAPWFFTPILAGLLSRRFGERRVWGLAMMGQSVVPVLLVTVPHPWIVAAQKGTCQRTADDVAGHGELLRAPGGPRHPRARSDVRTGRPQRLE